MISRLHLGLVLVALLQLISISSYAAERHALVIGNSNYKPTALHVTATDALDMAAQLQVMGYQLFNRSPFIDLDRASIERVVDEFAQSLPLGADAVFYFSGHGMATDRDSYLLPIDSNIKFQSDLRDRTISLRYIVDTLKSYNPTGVNVLLMDANRTNPLTNDFLGIKNGLDKLKEIPEGVFVGYASSVAKASPDKFAGRNSTYTNQLIASIHAQPGLSIKLLHDQVANTVFDKTNGAQVPVSDNRIYGSWCFDDCITVAALKTKMRAASSKPLTNIKPKPSRNYWKIAGGVALGLTVFLLTNNDNDDGGDPVSISLDPPGQ